MSMETDLQFVVVRSNFDLNLEIHCRQRIGPDLSQGQYAVAKTVIFEKQDAGGCMVHEPMIRVDRGDAESLMDELWIAGIRPSKRIIEPQNTDHMNGEIDWLRGVADYLMKRNKLTQGEAKLETDK